LTRAPLTRPTLSVIIPVHNAAAHLKRCLDHVALSTYTDYELIVVDDGSTDGSAEVAETYGCKLVRCLTNGGPAAARNRGIQEASGEILYFFDSDVCVRPDTLGRVADCFASYPETEALIGSYDEEPGEPDFLSQYRNLFHHWIHQGGSSNATTFWSGCGAIRKSVLVEYGGFNEEYRRPSIEDIELGYRMRSDGRRMRLDKQLRVKHMKRWTFWQILRTDVLDRGIPWTELMFRYPKIPGDLNVTFGQKVNVVLTHLLAIAIAAAVVGLGREFVGPALLAGCLVAVNYWLFSWRTADLRARRSLEVLAGLAASGCAAYALGMSALMPVLLLGAAGFFIQHQLLRHRRDSTPFRWLSNLTALATLGAIGFLLAQLPLHAVTLTIAALALVLLAANIKLYAFLARRHDVFFAFTAIPFHWMYYYYCGVSFAAGVALHLSRKLTGQRRGVRRPADDRIKAMKAG
jgi:GT2 family glycosyltransferase